MPAAVTPSSVRDGDPAALAGLCAVRGPSVLAYCRHVAGVAAGDAAADAFASFRRAVVETSRPEDLNPEALLISATRAAAASHASRAPLGVCAVVPLLLASRADKTIAPADHELLEQHLEGCWACRGPVARFEAAERAYRDPPDPLMDPAIIAAIIAAMAAATPAAGPEPPASMSDGSAPVAAPAEPVGAVEPQAAAPLDQPTTEFQTPDVLEPDPAAAHAAATEPARPAGRAGRVPSLIGSLGLRPRGELRLPPRVDEPEPDHELVLEAVEQPERPRERRAGRGAIGAHIPRVRRTPPRSEAAPPVVLPRSGAGAGGGSRSRRPFALMLPVAVVLVALLTALFVAGVFGGDDPASSPRVAVPADVPASSTPADVVVVSGAKEARAEDVESAKARERARARRKREAAAARADAPKASSGTPAAATAPPAPVVTPPPPPPPPADGDGGGSRKVDAGNGATGAEQIPPAEDTSTVPDLAPAPEPATAP